ncbi:hypothetical protein [Abyssibacter sp.]|uniref:hypothetical protein n=1 Tax=Abyssibacter sp. TaxID=2320200 RepID=UPI003515B30B
MEAIYELIQANPGYFAWALGLTNVGWGAFVYFNSQSHQRALADKQHELDLDLERRKHIFELRLSQYEKHLSKLDSFGKSYQSEMLSKMQPFMAEYFQEMLSAQDDGEKDAAITRFSTNIMSLMNDASAEYHVLKSESQSLKLTASDALVELMEELESLMKESMDSAGDFVKAFPQLILACDQLGMKEKQSALEAQGQLIQAKSAEMQAKMRKELNEI